MTEKAHPLRALCDRVGISRRELEAALADGAVDPRVIAVTGGGHRKLLDLDVAEAQLRAYLDNGQGATDATELDRWRAHRERFAALREELRYRQEAGLLWDGAQVERQVRAAMTLVRQRLEQIPGQLAAELAATTDTFDVEQALGGAVRAALSELAVKLGDVEISDGGE